MNKTAIVITVAAVILLGGFFLLRGQTYQTSAPQTAPTAPPDESEAVSVPETEVGAAESVAAGEELSIESGSFFFTPDKLSVQKGTVTVNVTKNSGFHTFVIDELGVEEQLSNGATFSFNADPGTYEYYCGVPGHKENGMFGTLTVN